MSNDVYSVRQAAQLLGVTVGAVILWINDGSLIGAYKINPLRQTSPYRIPKAEIERFLALRNPGQKKE